jgi:peptidoglycan/LPS O-acetylase OafA/YrhL
MIPQAFMLGFGPDTSSGLLPMPHVLGYYAIFFGFGALYYNYDDPDGRVSNRWWLALPLGLLVIFPLGLNFTFEDSLFNADIHRLLSIFLQAIYPWIISYGLMGLFRKLFANGNKTMLYLSASSYWLYLAHLPLIVAANILVRDWQLPAIVKFVLIIVVVTGFLLITYQTLVRYSWLGRFLNDPRERPAKI